MVTKATPAVLDLPFLTPESYGADGTAGSDAATEVASFLSACVTDGKLGLLAARYRLDSAVSFGMSGTTPGEHISLMGAGQNMRSVQVNNSTGGLHFNGTGVARQHTVTLRSLHFDPLTADSGYPFKITGAGGGLSTQSGVVLDGVYVGSIDESSTADFNEGVTASGIYRVRINDLRIVQPTTAANKWAHGLEISNVYYPVVRDLWINVAGNLSSDSGGATFGIKWDGTTEEAGYFSNCTVNGADEGLHIERTGREPHFQWIGGHINSRKVGMRLNGIKYGIVFGPLMYSEYVPTGTDHVDFLVEDADGVTFQDCKFRMDGNDRRHWHLEPKSGKAGAVVRNVVIHLDQADLFSDTSVAPIYCNGATNVTIYLPDEPSSSDFASYPDKLVEFGPSQDASEVKIILQSGLRKSEDGSSAGPDFILDRYSSSPAAGDNLGRLRIDGRNAADEKTEYASITGRILDATNGSEDGSLSDFVMIDGTLTEAVKVLRGASDGKFAAQIAVNESGTHTLRTLERGPQIKDGGGTRAIIYDDGASEASDDTGKLLATGAFGLGGSAIAPPNSDLNDITVSGVYQTDSATLNRPPQFTNGVVLHLSRSATLHTQLALSRSADGELAFRRYSGGAWSDWFRVFSSATLLGTVSQSSGTPTGAVIESGSNANGEYTRWADGTQICTNGNAAITTDPAAFTGTVTSVNGDKLRVGRWF